MLLIKIINVHICREGGTQILPKIRRGCTQILPNLRGGGDPDFEGKNRKASTPPPMVIFSERSLRGVDQLYLCINDIPISMLTRSIPHCHSITYYIYHWKWKSFYSIIAPCTIQEADHFLNLMQINNNWKVGLFNFKTLYINLYVGMQHPYAYATGK